MKTLEVKELIVGDISGATVRKRQGTIAISGGNLVYWVNDATEIYTITAA